MAKMVPKIVKRAGTLNRHLRVVIFTYTEPFEPRLQGSEMIGF